MIKTTAYMTCSESETLLIAKDLTARGIPFVLFPESAKSFLPLAGRVIRCDPLDEDTIDQWALAECPSYLMD